MNGRDAFLEFAAAFADGQRWKLLQADDWDEFQRRLAEVVGELPVRRRQALMMLLVSMIEGTVDSDDVRDWIETHDVATDDGIEAMIAWLRERRASCR